MNEEKTFSVVTVDTASIQKYVFASNKLKENIGASFIIEELLYKQLMVQAIRSAAREPNTDLLDAWRTNPEFIALLDRQQNAEIAYIGGGNAMILFQGKPMADEFIRLFSMGVLSHFPGIQVVFGRKDKVRKDDLAGSNFKQLRKELNLSLRACRDRHFASPSPFKPGIVQDCPSSNEAAELPDNVRDENGKKEKRWVSGSTKAKLQAASMAFEHVQRHYSDVLKGRYVLTNEIDQLGQKKDKGYVAVVHADGNGIGKKFLDSASLVDLRKLSVHVSDIADRVMRKLLGEVIGLHHKVTDKEELELVKFKAPPQAKPEIKALDNCPILPVRPILAAGDDITFVCEGRLGVYLAERILTYFEEEEALDGEPITACAGVAICKTHYPFFKAYSLSEELIKMSKDTEKKQEEKDAGFSWLHFLAAPTGYNGNLKGLLNKRFSVPGRRLLNGPYPLKHRQGSLEEVMDRLRHYGNSEKWPTNKLMEMRDAFRFDKAGRKLFLMQAQARGLPFHTELKDLFPESNTEMPNLIFDCIQLADFYPKTLIQP